MLDPARTTEPLNVLFNRKIDVGVRTGMPKKKSWKRVRPEFVFGRLPEHLEGESDDFVLVEQVAALTAIRALRATTWAEFVAAGGESFQDLIDDWGEEIKQAYGRQPVPEDRFSLSEYWGAWYFADLITDPRQAAFDTVMQWPDLTQIFEDTGFEFSFGPPGWPGVETISFREHAQAEQVVSITGLKLEHDEAFLRSCLP